ncbi:MULTISPECIES: hypothetical protein [Sphingobium]|uniref:hypothetical protein n=1 Tax=Sphingobium TaxID=165695 RepID=UPI0020A4BC68|nr:hypothetical protein [Sphingobium indicum]
MTERSSRAEVRNPVLRLPAIANLQALDPAIRQIIRTILLELRADARALAEKSWRQRKAPMASYWAAVSVYSGHFARAISNNLSSVAKRRRSEVMENAVSICGPWGEHPDYPVDDWKYEVVNGETRLGYWSWVASHDAQADEPIPSLPN